MVCTSYQPSLWTRRWARRLRIVAALVTILAGIPGTVATIAYLTSSYWIDSPKPLPPPPSKGDPPRPGPRPGRCQEFHVYKDGQCQDVRLRDKN